MAEDARKSTHETPTLGALSGHTGDALGEVAGILAGALLRLRGRRSGAANKREISRDNCLEGPRETSPDAIDLTRKDIAWK